MGALAALLPSVINWAGGFFEDRREIGKAKAVAKIEQQKTGATSLTGRIIVIFWFYPAIALYIPWLAPSAQAGFTALTAAPEWYLGILGTITTVVLGIDKFQRFKR